MSGHKGGTQALALAILLAVASGVVVSLGHGVLLLVTLASIIIAWRTSDTYIAEWVLAGYLLAGTFKVAFNLPVDLTLALAVALVAVSLVRVIRSGFPNDFTPVLLVFPVVAVFLILGAFVPQASEYGLVKGLRFASLGILAVSSAWLLIRDDRSGNALMRALTILAGIICVGALFYGGVGSPTGRITFFGGNTIALGRAGSLAVVGCITIAMSDRRAAAWALPLGSLSAVAMLGSGSRGPLVSLVLALGAMFLLRLDSKSVGRWVMYLSAAGVLVAATGLWTLLPQSALDRYAGALAGAVDKNVVSRMDLFVTAREMFFANPLFGAGTGSFAANSLLDYPHNLILELAAENGLLVASLVTALLLYSTLKAIRYARCTNVGPAHFYFAVLVSGLFGSLVSGDVNSNRLLYVVVVIVIMAARRSSRGALV